MVAVHSLQEKVVAEIRLIPADRLPEIFDIVHFFRIGLEVSTAASRATPTSDTQPDPIDAFCGKGRGGSVQRLLADRQADRAREA